MRKLNIAIFIALSLLFIGCGTKIPFKDKEPLSDSALIYLYVVDNMGEDTVSEHTTFNMRINSKNVKGRIDGGEYKSFDIKPSQITVTIVRGRLEERTVTLNVVAGKRYFLRAIDNLDGGDFELREVTPKDAKLEIAKTTLCGKVGKDKTAYIPQGRDLQDVENSSSGSTKLQNIEKAYELKEKGILSQDEFNTLKAKILAQ